MKKNIDFFRTEMAFYANKLWNLEESSCLEGRDWHSEVKQFVWIDTLDGTHVLEVLRLS